MPGKKILHNARSERNRYLRTNPQEKKMSKRMQENTKPVSVIRSASTWLLMAALTFISPFTCSAEPKAEKPKETEKISPISFDLLKRCTANIDLKMHSLTLEDLEKYWGKKDVYFVDLRSESDYKQGHFEGAVHLGADIDEKKLERLIPNKNATLITYCNNSLYPTRMIALTYSCLPQFISLGYKNVYTLEPIWRGKGNMPDISKNKHWVKQQ